MKEYEIASLMSEGYSNCYSKTLNMVASAIGDKHLDLLDMSVVRVKMEETLEAIEIKKRFDVLVEKSNRALKCSSSGFELDTHKFETLDEVEKALNNKAFL